MTHEENNIGGRAENPVSDEQKISEMLVGLERVEAPKDFDFRLKARIANARPADYQRGGLLPILKYALPLALFLVVGAGIMLNSSYTGWRAPETVKIPAPPNDGPLRADVPELKDNVPPVSSPDIAAANKQQVLEPGSQLSSRSAPGRRSTQDVPGRSVSGSNTPEGFSRDSAVRPAPTPIVPPEFRNGSNTNTNSGSNSSATSSQVPSEMAAKPLSVREALESIGVEVNLEENKWKVKAVKVNGIAFQMGLKPGDRIESIDGKATDEKTVYKDGSFKVKTIRVRRGGGEVDLTLPKAR